MEQVVRLSMVKLMNQETPLSTQTKNNIFDTIELY